MCDATHSAINAVIWFAILTDALFVINNLSSRAHKIVIGDNNTNSLAMVKYVNQKLDKIINKQNKTGTCEEVLNSKPHWTG